mmetsp:Transcript_86547/g.280208  ORF Transcript_86547/g.280208 Transcript_86547/m.280208 type:complete len:303 (-) Transcript_86547:189-1097(-)
MAAYAGVPEADGGQQRGPASGLQSGPGAALGAERLRQREPLRGLPDLSLASPWLPWSRSELETSQVDHDDTTRLQTPAAHAGPCEALDRPADRLPALPPPPSDLPDAQRVFERCQTELLLQSRRQDEVFDCIAKVEADLSRVVRLAAENEGLHATERHRKHMALANLTRRTEDALLTCESLRRGQEHLMQKVEHLEALSEDGDGAVEEARKLQLEVGVLQDAVREKLDVFGHALRRLDAVELVCEENTKLRHEVEQLRRAGERRDLELAAMQGQLDALTKLVREQLREPPSPPHRSRWATSG